MSQIICPIQLEPQVIVRMDHLMRHCILQMSLVLHCICAYPYTVLRVEAAGLSLCAASAMDVMAGYIATQLLDVILEKADYGTWIGWDTTVSKCIFFFGFGFYIAMHERQRLHTVFYKIIALILTAFTIAFFISNIPRE